ncbi:MAG: glycosyltransferase family 2 protein [Methylococcales bacterium]|nr:glycosyltransferase family 2 protein [Methylococcales bacterium]
MSIIIPTYNRCSLLKRALESVYQQTYLDYEIIVVDDGSTDETAKMIKLFFPEVNYDFQVNQGVSAARNRGIGLAKGHWFAFLDSDDEWMPKKLENQMCELKSNLDYKICHTQEQWIRNAVRVNQMKKHKKTGGWIFKQCLPLCAMSPSSIVIHRTVFDDVGNFDITLPACEDYDLWLRITAKYPVLYLEDELIKKYGGHEDQLSTKYWGMDQYRIKALQKIILSNKLNEENKQQAISMLLKKCNIFKNGALKRDKIDEAQYYQQIINDFLVE